MSDNTMKQALLTDIIVMRGKGEFSRSLNAPEAESLRVNCWAKAVVEGPKQPRSVHLKLDPNVYEFSHWQDGGKGHLVKMQSVLRVIVNANRHS